MSGVWLRRDTRSRKSENHQNNAVVENPHHTLIPVFFTRTLSPCTAIKIQYKVRLKFALILNVNTNLLVSYLEPFLLFSQGSHPLFVGENGRENENFFVESSSDFSRTISPTFTKIICIKTLNFKITFFLHCTDY